MSIDAQTFDELFKARRTFSSWDVALTAVLLGDCAFSTSWATGDNRRDLGEFARRMNFSRIETLDVAGNPTIRADITKPLPVEMEGAFDIVLDIGTLYWCFDVASAWRNCLSLLKPVGLIGHHSGLTGYFGRGYYNFSPRLFRDLYRANGFDKISIMVRVRRFFEEQSVFRRVSLRFRPPARGFIELEENSIYLNEADWRSLRFGPSATPAATMLPNDAEILCLAQRSVPQPFATPLLSL